MQQLRMKCKNLKPAEVVLQPGYSIIDSSSEDYSEEVFSKEWAAICEELNGKYDESLYKSMMLDDRNIPKDAILFVKDLEGSLISTATVLMTEVHDEAVLHMVGTKQSAKGIGAGSAVCASCVNYAIRKGIKQMSLKTDEFRIPAVKIYYKLGFLPYFFEPDMRERWTGVMKDIGLSEFKAINEQNEIETVSTDTFRTI